MFDDEPELFQSPWARRIKKAFAFVGCALFIGLTIAGFYLWFVFRELLKR